MRSGPCAIATSSSPRRPTPAPVLSGSGLRPGRHMTAPGADDPAKRELDGACLRRATRVIVDSRDLTLRYGDVHAPSPAERLRRTVRRRDRRRPGRPGSRTARTGRHHGGQAHRHRPPGQDTA
ncbi:hypothetical protein [Streptomyces sp. NPDC006134]|uniref:hypothetical protein n=1 Tax=Streptomyces sp. NPDC006134 TaxID=3154467 RepID=UPI00340305F1